MRILIIEDDKRTAEYVTKGLSEAGHLAEALADGREAMVHAMHTPYDVLVVDRMLPGLDGLSLVRTLRASGTRTPVIFLTSIGGVNDRVDGLEAGGDVYLVKPFAFSELLARINALGRRPAVQVEKTILSVADLELDMARRTVRRGDQKIDLQPREFTLLEVLMRNEGRVVTRTMLLERVWDVHFDPKTTVVETHISRLRAKMDKPFPIALLHTVRSTGYSIHAPL